MDEFKPNETIWVKAKRNATRIVVPNGRRSSDKLPAIGRFIVNLAIAFAIVWIAVFHGKLVGMG